MTEWMCVWGVGVCRASVVAVGAGLFIYAKTDLDRRRVEWIAEHGPQQVPRLPTPRTPLDWGFGGALLARSKFSACPPTHPAELGFGGALLRDAF